MLGLIDFNYGACNYLRYLNVTFNLGFDYREQTGSDAYGGNSALEIQMPFDPFRMLVGTPNYAPDINTELPTFSLAGRANVFSNKKDQFIGQAKFEIPIGQGISIPLSASIANRTDFVGETEVKGIIGVTIDTGALTNAFRQGLAPSN